MKKQLTLSDIEYSNRKKTTKREKFLNDMDKIIPWSAWVEYIKPFYISSNKNNTKYQKIYSYMNSII